jgi:hypothetical protein
VAGGRLLVVATHRILRRRILPIGVYTLSSRNALHCFVVVCRRRCGWWCRWSGCRWVLTRTRGRMHRTLEACTFVMSVRSLLEIEKDRLLLKA